MILTINGQTKDLPNAPSLKDAIASLCKNPALVIAELNGTIIDKNAWDTAKLNANDRLELISFVGGG